MTITPTLKHAVIGVDSMTGKSLLLKNDFTYYTLPLVQSSLQNVTISGKIGSSKFTKKKKKNHRPEFTNLNVDTIHALLLRIA